MHVYYGVNGTTTMHDQVVTYIARLCSFCFREQETIIDKDYSYVLALASQNYEKSVWLHESM